MADLTVANTILAQLGGRRFLAMTGARNLVGGNNTLSMQLPGNARYDGKRVNGVMITLTPADTYTVDAVFVRTSPQYSRNIVASRDDVYCDNLREVFTRLTGLATSL